MRLSLVLLVAFAGLGHAADTPKQKAVAAALAMAGQSNAADKHAAVAQAMAQAGDAGPPQPAKLAAVAAALDAASPPACDGDVCKTPTGPERFCVRLHVVTADGLKAGSGTVVRSPGGPVVLTARHVIDGAEAIAVSEPDGRWFVASTLGTSAADLAAVTCPPDRPAADVGEYTTVGAAVRTFGHPRGWPVQRAKSGVVLGPTTTKLYDQMAPTFNASLRAEKGDSGAGVFDADGRVVGVVSQAAHKPGEPVEGVSVVPAAVRQFLNTLPAKPMPDKPAAPAPKLTITRYTAGWCGPCQTFAKTYEGAAVQAALVRFTALKHDLTADRSLASVADKGVTGIPLLIATDAAGKEVGRLSGNRPAAEVVAWLDSLGK